MAGPAEIPREVQDSFLARLRGALRGDEQAIKEVGEVLERAGHEEKKEERGLVTRAWQRIGGAAGEAWATVTSWKRLRTFVVGSAESLIIETVNLAFKSILTVPLGMKFTGDTAMFAAFQVKAVLHYLSGSPVPESELALGSEYREEAKRIATFLASLGLRAGLFALPGIGALAAATVGKWLEGKVKASFGDQDPKIVADIRSLIPQ
ncbi:MAG: hypothetical protein HY720_00210 [Planctomycetes bacterium]|nr:hypothetical protein [Planctomycetota bacterium]